MGKRKRKSSRHGNVPKRAQKSNKGPLPPPPITPSTKCPDWWNRLRAAAVFLISGLTLVAAVVTLTFGPIWPTAPDYAPGMPSAGSVFGVPFTVTNRSVLFSIRHLAITCHLLDVVTSGPKIENSFVGLPAENVIEPTKQNPYICPFDFFIGLGTQQITDAHIEFLSTYESPWPFFSAVHAKSDEFTFYGDTIPPHWERGAPLR